MDVENLHSGQEFKELPDTVSERKSEGSEMCRIMEDMRNESLKEGIQEEKKMTVFRMLEAGKYLLEEIANISGLSLEEVNQLKAERNA